MTTQRNLAFLPHMWIYNAQVGELFLRLGHYLRTLGYDITEKLDSALGENYLYAKGEVPILLVAHLDTVHDRPPTRAEIVIKDGVASAPGVGLGADDRSGVAGIVELLKRGFRPHVILLDKEERGLVGARAAANALPKPDEVKYLIEMDRRGSKDCVFYSCANPEFDKYVKTFGFTTELGSCSDISELCPKWGLAGVNLSIGYYQPHTKFENLKIAEWWDTVDKVAKMLEAPPEKEFIYIKKVVNYSSQSNWTGGRQTQTAHGDGWGEDPTWRGGSSDMISVQVLLDDIAWTCGYSREALDDALLAHKKEIVARTEEFIWAQLIAKVDDKVGETLVTADEFKLAEQLAVQG